MAVTQCNMTSSIRKALCAALPALALFSGMPASARDVAALRDDALANDKIAWDVVEGLTTEVGPRPAASPAEARARDWAAAKLKALGFANVRIETYTMPRWVRGGEKAAVIAPFPQPLALTALGGSGATGPDGLDGQVVYFPTLDDLRAAPDGSLKGKIAFVSHAMKRTQDGSGYGIFGDARRAGPAIAATKGAAAIVIRSIGTDSHRAPHTGQTNWGKVTPIPAAALSIPDAENLERMIKRGKPVTLHLLLTPTRMDNQPGGNVIAEVPGSDPNAGIILLAAHLDSWDLGTGAVDDGAGVAIISAAAHRFLGTEKPRHTIRLLLAGAEEVGGNGGDAYFEAHKAEKHAIVMESDFGADRVWAVETKGLDDKAAVKTAITAALAPLGVVPGKAAASGGSDIEKLVEAGVPVIDLAQDGTHYFDLHHTPDDTLDKIDPAQLRQNVAAWVAVLGVTADQP